MLEAKAWRLTTLQQTFVSCTLKGDATEDDLFIDIRIIGFLCLTGLSTICQYAPGQARWKIHGQAAVKQDDKSHV